VEEGQISQAEEKVEMEKDKNRIMKLMASYSQSPLFTVFKGTGKRVLKMDCADNCFRKQLVYLDKERIKCFEEAASIVGVGEREEKEPESFPESQTEDFELDLTNILRHYIRLTKKS